MRKISVILVLAACGVAQATPTLRDFRIRGYMAYSGLVGGGAACSSRWLAACAAAGRLGLRASSDTLRITGPGSGWAMLNGTMIGCPEGYAAITSDSSGGNQQAAGTFPADAAKPSLVPATPFVVTPSGASNRLQIRTLNVDCIYEFTLTQATSYILGVQPQQWVSVFSRSSAASTGVALSPAALLAAVSAALAALHLLR